MQSELIEVKPQGDDERQFNTNEVLKEQKKDKIVYFLPCYVRFKVKEIGEVNIEELKGAVSGTLLFSFYYGNLEKSIMKQFIGGDADKSILFQFSRQQSVELKQEKGIVYKENFKERIIDFTIREEFKCNLVGDVFLTPFQIINLYLTFGIQSVNLDPEKNNGKNITIKFNCMTSKSVVLLSYSENCRFGNYDLMEYYLDSKFTNKDSNPYSKISVCRDQDQNDGIMYSKVAKVHDQTSHVLNEQHSSAHLEQSPKKEIEKKKLKQFQYVYFRIPLYKYPGANLISIFIPLWVLGFINLAIFFQEPSLSGRIAAIATLTLAFIAFIPTINETIPQTAEIKLVQILVYMQTLASVLCLIQSIYVFTALDLTTYVFNWSSDGFFISALILNLINVVVVFSLYILHKFYWEKMYNRAKYAKGLKQELIRNLWRNPECDKLFYDYIKYGKIKVL